MIILIGLTIISCQQEETPSIHEDASLFNEQLATELGADEYGMAQYVMAFLKKGPNRPTDPDEAAKLQAGTYGKHRKAC